MPHPEQEHGLMIEVARLRREVELWKLAKSNCAESNRRLQEALAAARRECEGLRTLAEKWALREAAGVERGIRADADALSESQALQAKVERLRGDLVKYGSHVDQCNGDDFCSCGLEVALLQAARTALSAPAVASGEDSK